MQENSKTITENDMPKHGQGKSDTPKKVLIACPTLGLDPDPDRWLNTLIKLWNNCRREGFTHAFYAPYRQLWWEANNNIWDTAFKNKFDYILRIDDDIHGIEDDAFSKLLHADKDVIGAAYPNRRFPYTVQAMVRTEERSLIDIFKSNNMSLQSVQFHGYKGQNIQQVELVGFGMTLIRVKPFKFLERPMYKGDEVCPDDSYFAQICLDNKIEQYVHWGVRLKHAHVTFANSGHLYNADLLEAHPEIETDKSNVILADPLEPKEAEIEETVHAN